MARHVFGGTTADYVISLGADDAATLEPGAEVTLWTAQTGGSQVTTLEDMTGVAVASVLADAFGAIPQFRGPDDDSLWLWGDASGGAGPRHLLIASDLAGVVALLGSDVASLVSRMTAAETSIGRAMLVCEYVAGAYELRPDTGRRVTFVGPVAPGVLSLDSDLWLETVL